MSLHAQGPDDRAAQLLALTERLAERLSAETALFEARRPQAVAASLAATAELAALYRGEHVRLRREPSLLKGASPARLAALRAATQRFEAVLARHGRAVHAARTVTEGLVQAVAAEVARTRSAAAGYGPGARPARADTSAITLNARA